MPLKLNDIGIGFDSILEAFESLGPILNRAENEHPPFRIGKVSNNHYAVEVDVAGYEHDDISIDLSDIVLKISMNHEKDDNFYTGIDTDVYMLFLVSRNFHLSETSVKNGILYMTFINTYTDKRLMSIDFATSEVIANDAAPRAVEVTKVTVETVVAEFAIAVPEVKVVPAPVAIPVMELPVVEVPVVIEPVPEPVVEPVVVAEIVPEPVVVAEVVPEPTPEVGVVEVVPEVPVPEPTPEVVVVEVVPEVPVPVIEIVLDEKVEVVVVNADDKTSPTTAVSVPLEMTPVVEVVVTAEPLIDVASEVPQVHIELVPLVSDAPILHDEVVVPIATSNPEKTDVSIILDPVSAEILANANVDIVDVVTKAIEESKTELPPVVIIEPTPEPTPEVVVAEAVPEPVIEVVPEPTPEVVAEVVAETPVVVVVEPTPVVSEDVLVTATMPENNVIVSFTVLVEPAPAEPVANT